MPANSAVGGLTFEGTMTDIRPNGFSLGMSVKDFHGSTYYTVTGAITRSLDVYKTNGIVYYFLNDKKIDWSMTTPTSFEGMKIRINGNGSNQNGESNFVQTDEPGNTSTVSGGRVFQWSYPCQKDSSWGLLAHTASILQPDNPLELTTYNSNDHCIHGSGGNVITRDISTFEDDGSHSSPYGIHSRMEVSQIAQATRFQTLLLPYKCKSPNYPEISRNETVDYSSTTLHFFLPTDTVVTIPGRPKSAPVNVQDTIHDFHLVRMETGVSAVADPFVTSDITNILEANAESVFMSRSNLTLIRPGACDKSIIPFKQGQIMNGTYLKYDDTLYISTTTPSTISYVYADKFFYKGFVSAGTTVSFYMPDMEYGFQMVGKMNGVNQTTTHYPFDINSFMFITVTFSRAGEFTLELADPCAGDCYFPPTATTIDTLFEFDLGVRKPLDHDLDIVSGGHLHITNASRMNICPDNVLVNKDSLTMHMTCVPQKTWLVDEGGNKSFLPADTLPYICDRTLLMADRGVNETRNLIVVNNNAALVLDNGSVTHIGNNSTILIKPGGTLLIKAGATVIIGDSGCHENRGELLADHGSYVCIESGANMFFLNEIDSTNFYYTDTLDRHIVYIAMPDDNGHYGAIAGTNASGGRGKFVSGDLGVWAGSDCTPFCELIYKNPPYGVDNRPFGWFNVGLPRALFFAEDTLCLGRVYKIDATPSLNETGYSILVCKYDTLTKSCLSTVLSITESGDFCLGKRDLFTPTESGYYKTRLIVKTDCNLTDTFSKILYVPYLPVATFSLSNDSICPGIGTLVADGFLSTSNIKGCRHTWSVTPILDDSISMELATDSNIHARNWNITNQNYVDSNFSFSDYKFIGGMTYLISLKIKGWCTDSVYTDTVYVPLKVNIDIESVTTYDQPIGPASIKLKAQVSGASSWYWSPTDWIDYPDSLNIVITTNSDNDSVKYYTLTATSGACSLSDQIAVKFNRSTNSGDDITVCGNAPVLIGTDFNAPALFGVMYMIDPALIGAFRNNYDGGLSTTEFMVLFSKFMIERQKTYEIPPFVNSIFGNQTELKALIKQRVSTDANLATYYDLLLNGNLTEFVDALWYFENFASDFANADVKNIIDSLDLLYPFPDQYYWPTTLSSSLNFHINYFNHYGYSPIMSYNVYHQIHDLTSAFESWLSHGDMDEVNVSWGKSFYDGYAYNMLIVDSSTKTYTLTTEMYSTNEIKFDKVTVFRDSVMVPSFEVLFQVDSTVTFIDDTKPVRNTYKYLWTFGDGDSSRTQNSSHTFRAFDSAYVVCLYVTNNCNTYQYCDTIYVDSMGLKVNGFSKRGAEDTDQPIVKKQNRSLENNLASKENQLNNIPNPFTDETSIHYLIRAEYSKATIHITDLLGRSIKEVSLNSQKGKITFDGSSQSAGIYYVSLIVDGTVVKSKTMLIDK